MELDHTVWGYYSYHSRFWGEAICLMKWAAIFWKKWYVWIMDNINYRVVEDVQTLFPAVNFVADSATSQLPVSHMKIRNSLMWRGWLISISRKLNWVTGHLHDDRFNASVPNREGHGRADRGTNTAVASSLVTLALPLSFSFSHRYLPRIFFTEVGIMGIMDIMDIMGTNGFPDTCKVQAIQTSSKILFLPFSDIIR